MRDDTTTTPCASRSHISPEPDGEQVASHYPTSDEIRSLRPHHTVGVHVFFGGVGQVTDLHPHHVMTWYDERERGIPDKWEQPERMVHDADTQALRDSLVSLRAQGDSLDG